MSQSTVTVTNPAENLFKSLRSDIGKIEIDYVCEQLAALLVDDAEFEKFADNPKIFMKSKGLMRSGLNMGALVDLMFSVKSRMFAMSNQKAANETASHRQQIGAQIQSKSKEQQQEYNFDHTKTWWTKYEKDYNIYKERGIKATKTTGEQRMKDEGFKKKGKEALRENGLTLCKEKTFHPGQPLVTPALVKIIKKRLQFA